MKKLPQQVKIEKTNEMYKARVNKYRKALTFKLGDLVWLHLRKERFPSAEKQAYAQRGWSFQSS